MMDDNRGHRNNQETVAGRGENPLGRMTRPDLLLTHKRISLHLLRDMHERCGLKTLFCNYVDGIRFVMPAAYKPFVKKWRRLSRVINLPFGLFNRVSEKLGGIVGYRPRTSLFSIKLMYIGKKD